jgi:hypothetical protein
MPIEDKIRQFEQNRQNMQRQQYPGYSYYEYPKWVKARDGSERIVQDEEEEDRTIGADSVADAVAEEERIRNERVIRLQGNPLKGIMKTSKKIPPSDD